MLVPFFRRLAADDGSNACAPIVRRGTRGTRIRLPAPPIRELAGAMTQPGFDDMWLPHDHDPRMSETSSRGEHAVLVRVPRALPQHARAEVRRPRPPPSSARGPCRPRRCRCSAWCATWPGRASWFRRVIEAQPDLKRLFQDEDAGFELRRRSPETLVDEACARGAARSPTPARSRRHRPRTPSVDVHGDSTEVRDVIVHMIEEYARHVGHADLLRECIDGRTGQ